MEYKKHYEVTEPGQYWVEGINGCEYIVEVFDVGQVYFEPYCNYRFAGPIPKPVKNK